MREPDLSFSWESLGIRCIFSPREKSNLLHKLETLGRASVPEWKARIHPQALHRFLVSICKAPCRSDVWCLYHNLSQWRTLSSPLSETIGGESRTARPLSFIESLPSPSVTNPHCRKHRSQFSSVVQSCPTLWDPVNCSTPRLPVHHQLPEFTQTHVHWVGDAILPSHPLSSPSPPARNPSQHQGLFQWVNSLHEMAKVLEFQPQYQSFQWTPRTGLLQNGLVGSPCSPRDSQESSPTPKFKSSNSLALSFLHSPTLTFTHDH